MSLYHPNPPPARAGVGPSCVVLPAGPWATVADFLFQRFPGVPQDVWLARMQAGDVVDDAGARITAQCAYTPQRRLYYYRAVEAEPRIPFDEVVLWQDEHLLVVDKPHFLPVMPSGKYLQETVLVRLKNKLGLPHLVPIHRIDRDTAGLVLFSVQPTTRDAYHALFRNHQVSKTYEAIAPWNPALTWPRRMESRIEPSAHFMQQTEVAGPPNAVTDIDVLQMHGRYARYQLKPITGQRHQLRVHMAALGLQLVGDGIYPSLTPEGEMDHQRPLQLLAKTLAFVDPLSGHARTWHSAQALRSLTDVVNDVPLTPKPLAAAALARQERLR
jgi:tRNA pseudouridine32 synthase / 23S rRNA pseudouridine746 synthase